MSVFFDVQGIIHKINRKNKSLWPWIRLFKSTFSLNNFRPSSKCIWHPPRLLDRILYTSVYGVGLVSVHGATAHDKVGRCVRVIVRSTVLRKIPQLPADRDKGLSRKTCRKVVGEVVTHQTSCGSRRTIKEDSVGNFLRFICTDIR